MNIKCLFKHQDDGTKKISYVDEFGKHYMSQCKRCGKNIFFKNENEELYMESKFKSLKGAQE